MGDGEAPRGSGAHCGTTAPPASTCSSPGLGEGAATDQGEPFERLVITTGGAAPCPIGYAVRTFGNGLRGAWGAP